MRGRIGIAHLSNFGLGVKSLFEVFPSTPRHFYKNSVRHSTVGQSYVSQLPSSKTRTYACRSFFRIGISQNSFLFVPTYFYAHSYGASTEKLCLTFLCTCAQKVKTNFQHLVKASSEFDIRRRQYQCSDEAITLHFYIHTVYLNLLPAAKGEMLKRIWKWRHRRHKLPNF